MITEHEFKLRTETLYKEDQHHYCMDLEKGLVIDCQRVGNQARTVNHSCDPNCIVQKWIVRGIPRVAIFAARNIERDEEITYDYKFRCYNLENAQKCFCGSAKCRGLITGKGPAL